MAKLDKQYLMDLEQPLHPKCNEYLQSVGTNLEDPTLGDFYEHLTIDQMIEFDDQMFHEEMKLWNASKTTAQKVMVQK